MNVVLRDLDLDFQGKTCSACAFAIKNAQFAEVLGRFDSIHTTNAVELLLFLLLLLLAAGPT